MRWFGQVDDADERWEMDVEKVVGQVGVRQHKVGFELVFSGLIPRLIPTLFLVLTVLAE
jgi:hypothetical protein